MISASAELGIAAGREPGKIGVWVGEPERSEKLGAIGVHLSRWVTSHGFAYNVSTDLRYFDLIVPCGITGHRATSLEKILERAVTRKEPVPPVVLNFGEVFGLEMRETTREDLLAQLQAHERTGEPNL